MPTPSIDDLLAAAITAFQAMTPKHRQRCQRRLKDLGLVGRQRRGERLQVRNDRIRAYAARGLSQAWIGKREGISRGAVCMVLRRSRIGYVRKTCALSAS